MLCLNLYVKKIKNMDNYIKNNYENRKKKFIISNESIKKLKK